MDTCQTAGSDCTVVGTNDRASAPSTSASRILHVDEARSLIRSELAQLLFAHAARVAPEALDEDDDSSRQRRSRSSLPTLGLQITTGVGKSSAAAELAARAEKLGVPMLILTPTIALADDYVTRIRAADCQDVSRYVSRQSPEAVAADPDLAPWLCQRLEDVRAAGDQNHRPAHSVCRECPHGRKAVYLGMGGGRTRDQREQREQAALRWFRAKGIDPSDYTQCRFLYDGLRTVKDAPVIVAPAAAFSESLAYWIAPDGKKIQRLLIVDEAISPGRLVTVRMRHCERWIERMAELRDEAQRRAGASVLHGVALDSEGAEWWSRVAEVATIGERVFRRLCSALADGAATIDTESMSALLRDAQRADAVHSGVAAWERVVYDAQHNRYGVPLRALSALVKSAEAGLLRRLPTAVECFEPSPVLEWAARRGATVFMDATLPSWLRASINAWGGRTVSVIARQNICVERITGYSYPRGRPALSGYRAEAVAALHDVRAAALQGARTGGAWACIVHQSWLVYGGEVEYRTGDPRTKAEIAAVEAAAIARDTGCAVGWWGAHDRGIDYWSGRNLRLFGLPLLGLDRDSEGGGSMAQAWALARAAAITAGCALGDWPAEIGPLEQVAGGPPLPADPRVRRWLIDRYAADLVQAIGRARGVNSARTIRVELWGGISNPEMDAALAEHGIDAEACWPNQVHRTQRGRPRRAEGDVRDWVRLAIDALAAGGELGSGSVRVVAAQMRSMGLRASQGAIARALAEICASL